MDSFTGVIAEYNPFHNGHQYQLESALALTGAQAAIVAMSGSFTQRGEVAAADKFTRARWALSNGASMVLELPTVFSLASAERFARGGVQLLSKTGIVGSLSFGAEDADVETLRRIARLSAAENDAFRAELDKQLSSGSSYPAARAAALTSLHLDEALAQAAAKPNNILAIEYIKAIDALAPSMGVAAVPRRGPAHDAPAYSGGFASASALRTALEDCDSAALSACMPNDVFKDCIKRVSTLSMPCSMQYLSDALIYAVRRLSPIALADIPDVAEGLENVVYRSARECTDYASLLSSIKTKRYTLARIRRILACALVGVTKEMHAAFPAPLYIRVLGVRKDSLSLLSAMAENANLPVITCRADCDALSDEARAMLSLDIFAGELLAMASPSATKPENEFSRPFMTV